MKKRLIILSSILLGLVLLAGAAFLGLSVYHDANHVTIGQTEYYIGETQLDLSGQGYPDIDGILQMTNLHRLDLRSTGLTAQDYQRLRSALPQCNILWDVLFQGVYCDPDTSHFTVTELTDEDIAQLGNFQNLRVVDAGGCTDYPQILALQAKYPDCQVKYCVEVGGQKRSHNTTTLTVTDPDMGQIEQALRYLPKLKTLTLTGKLPVADDLLALRQAYPQVEIHWEYVLHGKVLTDQTTRLDLSGILMEDTLAVENALPYLPELTWVDMSFCGIANEAMDALNKRHADVRFVWTITFTRGQVRTDITYFMPHQLGYHNYSKFTDRDAAKLKYCTDIICMDMGHMYISDCSFLYYMPNMQYLLLGDTVIRDYTPIGSLKKLKFLELFLTRGSDLSPLARCEQLEDLNLGHTIVTNLDALKELPNLKNLWLVGAYYDANQLAELQKANPELIICTKGISSTGEGWRELPNYYAQRDILGMSYMTH